MRSPARKRASLTACQSLRPAPACRKCAWASIREAARAVTRSVGVAQLDERGVCRSLDPLIDVGVVRDGGIVVRAPLEEDALPRREFEEALLSRRRIEAQQPHMIDAIDGNAADAARLDRR